MNSRTQTTVLSVCLSKRGRERKGARETFWRLSGDLARFTQMLFSETAGLQAAQRAFPFESLLVGVTYCPTTNEPASSPGFEFKFQILVLETCSKKFAPLLAEGEQFLRFQFLRFQFVSSSFLVRSIWTTSGDARTTKLSISFGSFSLRIHCFGFRCQFLLRTSVLVLLGQYY